MTLFPRCLLCLALSANAALASEGGPQEACIRAADRAARETGVPARLLHAITLVETQHGGTPWPWTVNAEGEGNWYPDRQAAEKAARTALTRTDSLDIGCFQINTRWHAEGFPSIEAMFDPEANALYAANYLLSLHRQAGNWSDAVAAYHSQDPDRGRGYVERVGAILVADSQQNPLPEVRVNRFPLFVSGSAGARGSLVPRQTGGVPLIGGP